MYQSSLKSQLISPDSREVLIYQADQQQLDDKSGHQYPIEDGVPILLPVERLELFTKSKIHKDRGTDFHYMEHYQKDAEVFDYFQLNLGGATLHENRRLHEIISSEVPKNAKNILDVGCGKAWVAEHFCPKGKEVFSMDISTVNPKKAVQTYPFDNHHGVVADVYALPFAENSFDCIIASEIIEHVPNPRAFMDCLVKVLRPGGKLIITTPYKEKIVHHLCIHCNHPTPENAHLHSIDENILMDIRPKEDLAKARYRIFSNKWLIKLRSHIIFKHFPHQLWWFFDQVANKTLGTPTRILLAFEKK
jgi:2-polyprenyl-3-methyl-5-hydroxy-6-metoxy-1,4-benzoquinol methylase